MPVTVVIPNRNGSATIGPCLEAALRSIRDGDEIIVVDDSSTDDSATIIRRYPCRLIRLDRPAGASRARNIGALHGRGDLLFFTDADCLVQADTVSRARSALAGAAPGVILGGTYTPVPHDRDFFSRFQSAFINHLETRRPGHPDYVASHAMALRRSTFLEHGGFPEEFLPIIEDVEFSHRMQRAGHRMIIDPSILVQHIFRFSLGRSLRNALRKSRYWTRYSLGNRDLFADSGTASAGLKANVAAWTMAVAAAAGSAVLSLPALLLFIPLVLGTSAVVNSSLLQAWANAGGRGFGFCAAAYYLLVYPAAVAAGAALGMVEHLIGGDRRRLGLTGPHAAHPQGGACQGS